MSIDRLGKELDALGVSGRDIQCLRLLPQVYVGWQSERRNLPALEALLDTTANGAGFGVECLKLARTWLFERPTRAQFQSAFALMRALRRAPGEPVFSTSDLLESMLWAMRAAQLDRDPGPRGRAGPVAHTARRALGDLEAWLEIDTEDLAADLLDEEAPRSTRADSVLNGASGAGRLDAEEAPRSTRADSVLNGASGADRLDAEEAPHSTRDADPDSAVFLLQSDRSGPPSTPFPLVRRHA